MCVSFLFAAHKSFQVGCHGQQPLAELSRHIHHCPDEGEDAEHQKPQRLTEPPKQHGKRKIDKNVHAVVAEHNACAEFADRAADSLLLLILALIPTHIKGIVAFPSASGQNPCRKLRQPNKDRLSERRGLPGCDPSGQQPHPNAPRQDSSPGRKAGSEILWGPVLVEALVIGKPRVCQNANPLVFLVLDVLLSAPVIQFFHSAGFHHFCHSICVSFLRFGYALFSVSMYPRQCQE